MADEFARRSGRCRDDLQQRLPERPCLPDHSPPPAVEPHAGDHDRRFEADVGDSEWTTNAWCGVIMKNYVAKQLGRHIRPLPATRRAESFRDELKMLLNAYRAVAMLRRDFLGRFGDAPGGFHSATMDQMAFLRTFGTRLETVDLLGLMTTYETGKAKGYCGEVSFTDADVEATMAEMKTGRQCLIDDEKLRKGARLYHAFKAQIEANGFTSIAVKCWPEILHPSIDIAPCFSMTWLLTKGVVTAASCESDCADGGDADPRDASVRQAGRVPGLRELHRRLRMRRTWSLRSRDRRADGRGRGDRREIAGPPGWRSQRPGADRPVRVWPQDRHRHRARCRRRLQGALLHRREHS